jgi:hypothetical protein
MSNLEYTERMNLEEAGNRLTQESKNRLRNLQSKYTTWPQNLKNAWTYEHVLKRGANFNLNKEVRLRNGYTRVMNRLRRPVERPLGRIHPSGYNNSYPPLPPSKKKRRVTRRNRK